MKFLRYCKDKWISFFLFTAVLLAGGSLLLLVETPLSVACVIEILYLAGFFFIIFQDFLSRKEFYDTLIDASEQLEEISYLSEMLPEPSFQEGQLLYQILKKDEKYLLMKRSLWIIKATWNSGHMKSKPLLRFPAL